MLSSSILQSINQNRYAIFTLLIGAIVKLILQYPLISIFEVYGPLLATAISFGIICILNLKKIINITHPDIKLLLKRTVLISFSCILMLLVVLLVRNFLYLFLDPERKMHSFLIVTFAAIIGIMTYLFLSFKTGLSDALLGFNAKKLKNKLKLFSK